MRACACSAWSLDALWCVKVYLFFGSLVGADDCMLCALFCFEVVALLLACVFAFDCVRAGAVCVTMSSANFSCTLQLGIHEP